MPRLSPPIPVPVIYVIGSGRSGSTLLGQLLGGHPEVFYAGEVYNWKNNHAKSIAGETRYCSCGEALHECPFWDRVRDRMVVRLGEAHVDLKDRDPTTFARNNAELFRSTLREAQRTVLVDASKRHYRLDLLLASPEFDVTIVHLVRDARAKGFSVLKTREKAGLPERAYYTKMWQWQKKNLAMRALFGRHPRYEVVRYEDLVTDPETVVRRLLRHVDLAPAEGQFDRSAHTFHDFSGNLRARLRDVRPLRLDTPYLDALSARKWTLGTALTAAGLRAFGYPLGRSATRRALAQLSDG